MTVKEFLHTKNTYYSGVAGLMGGAIGGKAWHSALISSTIATIDVFCFPGDRPPHISGGKWFLGNLLSSTASGLIAYALGHGMHALFKSQNGQDGFAARERDRRTTDAPEKTR